MGWWVAMSAGIPFGNYLLKRRIARGGMAEVFLAVQKGPEGFERTVAVKRILPHLADVPQFQDMFMDEGRLAAQLSHPNIAHIYEFGSYRDNFFIAMEHIRGVDLGSVLMEGLSRPLPLEHVARIVAEVCSALNYAHHLKDDGGEPFGIVHRDISPQNIMVSFDGAVKVLDFGIAKAAHHVERTQPGVVRGKFSYMSPEQVVGHKLDGRSDLFCAGIVLHELCAAAPLFPRTDAVAAMQRIRKEPVPPPMRDGKVIPADLMKILKRALEKDAEDRYSTAADMQLDLERFLLASGQLSNSVLLGRYFSENYGALKEKEEARAASEPLREAEVFSTAGVEDGRPRLPKVEISGEIARHRRPGGEAETPLVEISGENEVTDVELFPVGDQHVETDAGTLEMPGKDLVPPAPPGPDGMHLAPTAMADAVPVTGQHEYSRRRVGILGGALGLAVIVAGATAGYIFTPELKPDPPKTPLAKGPIQAPPQAKPSTPESEPLPATFNSPAQDAGQDGSVVPFRGPDAAATEPREKKVPAPPQRTRVARGKGKGKARGWRGRAPRGEGYIYVKTVPWTQVYLGGRLLGITPLARVPMPVGRHRLTLKNPRGINRSVPVVIRKGKSTKVILNLGDGP